MIHCVEKKSYQRNHWIKMKLAISFFATTISLFSMCFYLMQTFFIAVEKTTNYFIILSEMRTESHHFVLCALWSMFISLLFFIIFHLKATEYCLNITFSCRDMDQMKTWSLICVWVCMRALNPHSIPFEILYPTIHTLHIQTDRNKR